MSGRSLARCECAVALLVAADGARVNVGQVTAGGAECDFLLDITYGIREEAGLFRSGPQQVIGDSLRTFRPYTGQLAQLLDQMVYGIGGWYGALVQCQSSLLHYG